MNGEAGEDVLAQRSVDALPEDLHLHEFGMARDLDAKLAALERIQKSRKSKRGPGFRGGGDGVSRPTRWTKDVVRCQTKSCCK